MNFTTLFIKRPVMTTLVMIAHPVLRHRRVPAAAGERSAERRLPDDHGDARCCRARARQTMAATVATPLEKQFSTIAGIDNMTSTSSLGQTQIVIQFALDRNIDAAAQDVQAAITQTLRQLPQGIIPPSYQKTNPADAPILTLALTSDRGAALDARRVSARRRSRSGSRWSAASRRCSCTARRSTRCASSSIRGSSRRATSRSRTSRRRSTQPERQPADGRAVRAASTALTVQATGQLENAEAVPRHHRRLPQRRAGASRARSAASPTTCRTTRPRAGTTAQRVDRARDPAPAGHEHRRRSRTRVKAALDAACRPRSRRRCTCRCSTTARRRSRQSVHDVTFTLELTLVLVVLVIFLFLRNSSATIIPSLALPMSIIGTFSVMYLLRLQPRQPVADGAHARRRLRGRRRDRDAREHRAPPRDGEAADAGGDRRRGGGRLHDPLDDASRSPRCSSRSCSWAGSSASCSTSSPSRSASRFSCRASCRSRSRRCCRAASCASDHGKQHGRFYQATERFYDAWLGGYERSLAWVMARRPADARLLGRHPRRDRLSLLVDAQGSLPDRRHRASCSATTEAAEGVSFDALVEHQQRSRATSSRRIRTCAR